MDLRAYSRLVRKRWRVVVAGVLVGIAGAAVLVWQATPKYEASARLFVAAKGTGGSSTGLQSSGQFSQDRVKSYAEIISSPSVTGPVAAQVGGGLTARQIAHEIGANAPLNTVLINVHVTDASARRAQRLVNAISDQFANYAAQLETTPGDATSPVKVTVVNRASVPTSPVSPKVTLDLILGLLLGLALGAAAAVFRELFDTSVKEPDQVRRLLGLPLLGAIAFDPDAPKHPLIVQNDPRSPRAEAFRQLRTNLQFVDIDNAPRSIVVTSSIPEEGKTTTTTNLAITLTDSGLRVLLLEGDLRRPRVAEYLGIDGSVGVTSVLIGKADLANAIQTWGPEGRLDVLPSGPAPPNPSELLGSQGMVDMLRKLEGSYDLVLIDAPPLLPVTDGAVLASLASGAVIITRHGRTKIDQLQRAVETLRSVDAHTYGVVFTMTPTKGPDAYYYGYGYRYDNDRAPGKIDSPPPQVQPGRRNKGGAPAKRTASQSTSAAEGSRARRQAR